MTEQRLRGSGRWHNPVLTKELRQRARSGRNVLLLAVYLVVLAGVTLLFIHLLGGGTGLGPLNPRVGVEVYEVLAFGQLLMLALLTPLLTAGAISGEKERLTWEVLLTTGLPARSLVWGKLSASLAFMLLLVASGLPVFALVYFFGGVEPLQLLQLFWLYLVTSTLGGSIGLLASATLRRTQLAAAVAAATMIVLVFVLPLGFVIRHEISLASQNHQQVNQPTRPFLAYFSPGLAGLALMPDIPDLPGIVLRDSVTVYQVTTTPAPLPSPKTRTAPAGTTAGSPPGPTMVEFPDFLLVHSLVILAVVALLFVITVRVISPPVRAASKAKRFNRG